MSLDAEQRREALRQIKDKVTNLKESPLYAYRNEHKYYPVIGEGNHFAKIMLIGEAPGRNEAETGRPFCGAAGKILDELCASIGLDRKDIYVTNIVKDRPQNNRDPLPREIELYGPFLDQQINIIQPDVIATLGRYSMIYIMEKFGLSDQLQSISIIHGKTFEAWADYGVISIVPLYHPAAAIYNPQLKETLKKDFQVLKKFL